MSPIQVAELIAEAVAEIVKLVAAGIPHGEALRRVRTIGADARQVDADVDAAGGR